MALFSVDPRVIVHRSVRDQFVNHSCVVVNSIDLTQFILTMTFDFQSQCVPPNIPLYLCQHVWYPHARPQHLTTLVGLSDRPLSTTTAMPRFVRRCRHATRPKHTHTHSPRAPPRHRISNSNSLSVSRIPGGSRPNQPASQLFVSDPMRLFSFISFFCR